MKRVNKSQKHFVFLTLSSFVTALSAAFFGYISLPLAAGLYASTLLFESNKKRFFSYVLPIVTFIFNFLINGFLSLEGVAYALLGALIYLLYTVNISKTDAVLYSSLLTLVLILISLALLSFDAIGVVRLSAISEFYFQLYNDLKNEFMAFATTLVEEDSLGFKRFVFNVFEAEQLFSEIIILTVPVLMVLSLVTVGLSVKIFDSFEKRYETPSVRKSEWSFKLASITAFFYLFLALISAVATDTGVISLSVQTLYYIFLSVFFYIGLRSVFRFISKRSSKQISFIILIGALMLFSTFIFELLSYVGAFVSVHEGKKSEN